MAMIEEKKDEVRSAEQTAVDQLVDAGLLDELMSRVDAGEVQLTGEGGFYRQGLARAVGDLCAAVGKSAPIELFGSAVNVAARLAALAGAGMILATVAVADRLDDARWTVEPLELQMGSWDRRPSDYVRGATSRLDETGWSAPPGR